MLIPVLVFAAAAFVQVPPVTDVYEVPEARNDKLYQAFGGEAAVEAVVDNFIRIALDDPRIAGTFDETNMKRFREKLEKQLCDVMGGPCAYDGFGMRESHQPLDITAAQWGYMVEDFQIAMSEAGVPFRAQGKLLALLAPMHRDVVAE
ncbi:MAG: group 1 truncated hemoglobin [Pseudomonadota bacterium]